MQNDNRFSDNIPQVDSHVITIFSTKTAVWVLYQAIPGYLILRLTYLSTIPFFFEPIWKKQLKKETFTKLQPVSSPSSVFHLPKAFSIAPTVWAHGKAFPLGSACCIQQRLAVGTHPATVPPRPFGWAGDKFLPQILHGTGAAPWCRASVWKDLKRNCQVEMVVSVMIHVHRKTPVPGSLTLKKTSLRSLQCDYRPVVS